MHNLAIDYISPSLLRFNPCNARTHSTHQIAQIKASIAAFGFTNPVLVDEADVLIAGHGRLEAALALGLETVPVIRLEHLSEADKRGLMLADNKIALNAGWDLDLLVRELADLSAMDLEFDLDLTGFDAAEIDLIIGDAAATGEVETIAEPDPGQTVITRPGDIWQLGGLCHANMVTDRWHRDTFSE